MGKNSGERRGLGFNISNHKKDQPITFVKGKENFQNPPPKQEPNEVRQFQKNTLTHKVQAFSQLPKHLGNREKGHLPYQKPKVFYYRQNTLIKGNP